MHLDLKNIQNEVKEILPPEAGSLRARLADDPLRKLVAGRKKRKVDEESESIRRSQVLLTESQAQGLQQVFREAHQELRYKEIASRSMEFVKQEAT